MWGFFIRGGWGLRVGASRNVQVLRCILRCLFIALNRPLKILVGHLPVVFIGYDRGVTKEGLRHVSRVLARQVTLLQIALNSQPLDHSNTSAI